MWPDRYYTLIWFIISYIRCMTVFVLSVYSMYFKELHPEVAETIKAMGGCCGVCCSIYYRCFQVGQFIAAIAVPLIVGGASWYFAMAEMLYNLGELEDPPLVPGIYILCEEL